MQGMRANNLFIRRALLLGIGLLWILWGGAGPVRAQITYQQMQLQLNDGAGDRILQQLFLNTCETGVKKCVRRANLAPQLSQLREPRFAKENPVLPALPRRQVDSSQAYTLFDKATVLGNLQAIVKAETAKGRQAQAGQKHLWNVKHPFFLSKILVALATATSSRFMYVGKEVALIEWIKTRPDNSVTIEELFHQSYVLNEGNIYLTLLTIENVLSDATFDSERENTLVNRKLTDLYAFSPNKFGDWYHFFGTMLAGYAEEPAQAIAWLYGVYRRMTRGELAEESTMDADKKGAAIGVQLRTLVDIEIRGRWKVFMKKLRVSTQPRKHLK